MCGWLVIPCPLFCVLLSTYSWKYITLNNWKLVRLHKQDTSCINITWQGCNITKAFAYFQISVNINHLIFWSWSWKLKDQIFLLVHKVFWYNRKNQLIVDCNVVGSGGAIARECLYVNHIRSLPSSFRLFSFVIVF